MVRRAAVVFIIKNEKSSFLLKPYANFIEGLRNKVANCSLYRSKIMLLTWKRTPKGIRIMESSDSLNLGTKRKRVASLTLRLVYSGREPLLPVHKGMRLVGSRIGLDVE
jgi:hypothetical protein